MAASVLFDAPGPKTRARHRLYGVISGVVLATLLALLLWQLWRKGQFAADFWEPFVTPRIVNVLVTGLWQTVLAAVVAIFGAMIIGLLFGPGKLSDHRLIRWPSWLIVEFFRAVPLLILIIAIWYFNGAEPGLKGYIALVAGLILYNGAVLAEIFRAGINAVPRGQSEAAYAIGMRKAQVMRIVLIPQAIKIMLPAIISQAVVALKDTSLGYAVLAQGLTISAKLVYGEFNNTLPTVFVIAVLYIGLNLVLTYAATWAQRRFAGEKHLEVSAVGGINDLSAGKDRAKTAF